MVIKPWLLLGLTLLTLVACAKNPPVQTAPLPTRYFVQTGHTVRGDFLSFFEQYGGVKSLGYPLTSQIVVDGWTVQYFEKGRLEYHPENEPAYRITVGWLGDLLHRRRPPIPQANRPPANDPNRRYFPETGHILSGDFLSYFDRHGGKVRFGWPISEPFLLDGRLTQDFQSARFFWTPEREPGITLEAIGRSHLKVWGLEEGLIEPEFN